MCNLYHSLEFKGHVKSSNVLVTLCVMTNGGHFSCKVIEISVIYFTRIFACVFVYFSAPLCPPQRRPLLLVPPPECCCHSNIHKFTLEQAMRAFKRPQ